MGENCLPCPAVPEALTHSVACIALENPLRLYAAQLFIARLRIETLANKVQVAATVHKLNKFRARYCTSHAVIDALPIRFIA